MFFKGKYLTRQVRCMNNKCCYNLFKQWFIIWHIWSFFIQMYIQLRRVKKTPSWHEHPVHRFNSILRNILPILYTYERMADLFKNPSLAAIKRPGNLKDMVVRAILDNPLLNGGFKKNSETCMLHFGHALHQLGHI